MDATEITILIGGIFAISLVMFYIIYQVYRKFLIYFASALSRDIQGLEEIPKPPLRNLVDLVDFLVIKRDEIEKAVRDRETEEKYDGSYQ